MKSKREGAKFCEELHAKGLARTHGHPNPQNVMFVSQVVDHIDRNPTTATTKRNVAYRDNRNELATIDLVYRKEKALGNIEAHFRRPKIIDNAMTSIDTAMANAGVSEAARIDIQSYKSEGEAKAEPEGSKLASTTADSAKPSSP